MREADALGYQLRLLVAQTSHFLLQSFFFPFARFLKPASLNKGDNLPQFVIVEPASMLLAPVNDDTGTAGEIDPIH